MAVKEVGGGVVATPPVSSDNPDRRDQYANVAQLFSLEAHAPEEVEPTEQDRRSAAYVGPENKAWRRKKLSASKEPCANLCLGSSLVIPGFPYFRES